jgi:hypothetical protein
MNYPISNYILSQAKKRAYIKRLGGKCISCRMDLIDKPYCADFHHKNPEDKEFNPSDLSICNFSQSLSEIDKCILLCSNCHRQNHFDIDRFLRVKNDIILKEKEVSSESINHFKKDGDIVHQVISLHQQGKQLRTISTELGISRTPIKRILKENKLTPHEWKPKKTISKEQIESLINKGITNKREIAKKLKCSCATIHNMFDYYNLRNNTDKEIFQTRFIDLYKKGITSNKDLMKELNTYSSKITRYTKKFKKMKLI